MISDVRLASYTEQKRSAGKVGKWEQEKVEDAYPTGKLIIRLKTT